MIRVQEIEGPTPSCPTNSNGPIAHLVERVIRIDEVAGSNPAGSTVNYKNIELKKYDLNWPILFKKEKENIEKYLEGLTVEHIGSTAVPGLSAKSVIDMMASIDNLEDFEKYLQPLKNLGYQYHAEIEKETPDRKFFQRRIIDAPWFHLSLAQIDSVFWIDHILFRDYLRTHPEALAEYETLKEKLATKHVTDFGKYNSDKTEFITSIIQKAKSKIHNSK